MPAGAAQAKSRTPAYDRLSDVLIFPGNAEAAFNGARVA